MKHPLLQYLTLALAWLIMCACSEPKKHQVIGVWSVADDEWGQQMLQEMNYEAASRPNVELCVLRKQPGDGTGEEMDAIESFIRKKVAAIILISNNRYLRNHMAQAIEAGIPVVLINNTDEKAHFTSRIVHNNKVLGGEIGRYVVKLLKGRGTIVELCGPDDFIDDRHVGIHQVLDSFPDIRIVHSICGYYRMDSTENQLTSLVPQMEEPIDLVLGLNDRMAIGAHRALSRFPEKTDSWHTRYIGVDCLMNDSIGFGKVSDGTIDASFLWPTGGTEAMRQVFRILDGEPYERELQMSPRIITADRVPALQKAWNARRQEYMHNRSRLDVYAEGIQQRTLLQLFLWVAGVFIIIMLALAGILVYMFRLKSRLSSKLKSQNKLLHAQNIQLEEQKLLLAQQLDQLKAERDRWMELQVAIEDVNLAQKAEGLTFRGRLLQLIHDHMSCEDLTIESLGEMMGMSRVQLFRRVKQEFQMSPNELLRTTRMEQAERLLRSTQLNVSEVAYRVGYSSVKYFSKCFKEHFGHIPSDVRR